MRWSNLTIPICKQMLYFGCFLLLAYMFICCIFLYNLTGFSFHFVYAFLLVWSQWRIWDLVSVQFHPSCFSSLLPPPYVDLLTVIHALNIVCKIKCLFIMPSNLPCQAGPTKLTVQTGMCFSEVLLGFHFLPFPIIINCSDFSFNQICFYLGRFNALLVIRIQFKWSFYCKQQNI